MALFDPKRTLRAEYCIRVCIIKRYSPVRWKMRRLRLMCFTLLTAAATAGCSTGIYLRPEAPSGTLSTVNPACPGAAEIIEFAPQNQYWVLLRVYATPPGRWNSHGTELRIHFWFAYLRGFEPSNASFLFFTFPSEEQKKVIQERSNREYLITASKPTVTVVLPDGSKHEVSIPIFEKPYDPKKDRKGWWDPGVQISPTSLGQFTVILPDIYVNGEKIYTPPIRFKQDEGHYAPVINC